MVGCARAIEEMGFDSVLLVDHIAIPPDDADGIGARYCGCLVQPGLARRHYRTGQSRLRCLDLALSRGPADGKADRDNLRVEQQLPADGHGHRLNGPGVQSPQSEPAHTRPRLRRNVGLFERLLCER